MPRRASPPQAVKEEPVKEETANPRRRARVSSVTSKFTIKIFGTAKLDVIYNTARPQAPGTPVFLVPKFAGGFSQHTMDINARKSQIGVVFTGPMIGEFQSGGRISAVFFDNTNPCRP